MTTLFGMVAYAVDSAFLKACDNTVATVMGLCYFIAPTFLCIALIMTIARGYVTGQGLQMDFSPLLKAMWLLFLLYFYPDMMNVLGLGLGAFPSALKSIAGSSSAARVIQQLTQPVANLTTPGGEPPSYFDFVQQGGQIISDLKDMLSNFSIMGLLTRLFTTTLVLLLRNLFFFVRQFILGFLYICGPIVISLSMVPAFAGLVKSWLQNYISVQLWALTFTLLDLMYSSFADTQAGGGGLLGNLQMAGDDKFVVMSISFVVMYCMVPWLTSMVIGSTTAQDFASRTVGAAVSRGLMYATGGASAAAGGAVGAAVGSAGGGAAASAVGNAASSVASAGGGGNAGNSAASSLPTVSMADAMSPSYRQRSSGIWV